MAVGGYGRREQCPGSDVDVVLVHRRGLEMAEVAERVWYPLWDAGLKLGHQVGTLPQLLEVASEHLDTATSLLAARPVAGDATVAHELAAAALRAVVRQVAHATSTTCRRRWPSATPGSERSRSCWSPT